MDHKKIILNKKQKIKVFFKALNKLIPFSVIILIILSAIGAAIGVNLIIPVKADSVAFAVFIIGITGVVSAGLTFLLCILCWWFVDEKVMGFYRELKSYYKEEADKMKKRILEDVIDDEILK